VSEQPPADDPLRRLSAWLDEAHAAGLGPPDTMTLATATAAGIPSARMVLLKALDERGAVFYTNRRSRKGRELAANPRAALVLHWPSLGRQARLEGGVEEVGDEESDAYWTTRPLASRLSAAASPQSEVVVSRAWLESRVAELAALGEEPPRPEHWGGYRVVPQVVELWVHDDDRLHDRTRWTRDCDGWWVELLAP
jgi:pyridoxamine 5'-phosphate oxidase